MAITNPSDIAKVTHWYDGPSATASPTWADSVGSDDLTGSGNMGFGTSINGLQTIDPNGAREVVFASAIAQPCDTFIVGITNSFAFNGTSQIIEAASSGSGHILGWTADGGAGHRGRLYADCGTLVDAPQDGRVIEQVAYVFHLRADGASSEVRVNGAYHWAGDFGSGAMDGFKIENASFDYGEIVITDSLLTDVEVGELLEYFNGRWAKPNWAPNRHRVVMVASSATPADSSNAAQTRFSIEQRGHEVTYVASGSLTAADLVGYSAIVYDGDYADRNTNAPLIRAALDAGTPCWVNLYESGMSGAVTDTVACQLDLVDEVQTGASFAYGNTASVTAHPITDFLGTAPQTIGGRSAAEYAYFDPVDNAIGTNIADDGAGTRDSAYAIAAGTTDLNSGTIFARVVMSGHEMIPAQYYSTTGTTFETYIQNIVDWLLDSLSPPSVNTVTSGLRLVTPKFGEIIDPTAGDVTFSWRARSGRTATLDITTDISAPSPVWVTIATGIAGTSQAVDMSNATTWPEGIWYGWRIVWDDEVTWTHPGFKLLSTTSGTGFGHVFIDFEHVPGAGDTHTLTWTQTHGWWGGLGDYNGLAAKVLVGTEETSMASPPGLPSGFTDYEIGSYFRVGALTSPYFGQSTLYWAAEGQGGGLGLYATGSDVGIAVTAYPSNIFPFSPCPGEGRSGSVAMDLRVKDGAGNNSTFQISSGLEPSMLLHAWPSPCKENEWLVPIRMVVHQVNPTSARVLAGLSGYNGTTYWLLDETTPFDFSSVSDVAGWVLTKIAGNEDAGGFRDMYSLSVSALSSGSNILPPSTEFPSQPCVVRLDVYEADRTTVSWTVTDDPADASDVKLLMELSNYGAQVVDFLNGSASLATVTIGIIDPPTIAGDQDSGIITGRMHDALARGAIRGRRGRLRRFISPTLGWVTIADGDCMEPYLNASYSSFSFAIRDTRERERKTKAFQHGSTTSLMPRGVIRQGVGAVALGNSIPNVEHSPLVARFSDDGNHSYFFDFAPNPAYWDPSLTSINSHRVIILDDAWEAGLGRLIDTGPAAGTPGRYQHFDFPKVVVWWRPVGGTTTDWVKIKPRFAWLDGPDITEPNVFMLWATSGITYQGEEVRAARGIRVLPAPTGFAGGTTPTNLLADAPLPTVGVDYEVLLTYIGPPTDSMPFHWEGELGEGLALGYDGEFSPKAPSPAGTYQADEFDPGVTVNTGIRYDAAVLAAMTEEVIIRVTEPVADLRAYFEKYWYAPSGYAPALDLDGQVSPLHRRFPSSVAGLTTIDNTIAKAEPGWQMGTTIINLIQYKYGRLFFSPVDEDGFPIGDVDAIVRQEVEVWYVAAGGNLPIEVTGPEFLSQVSDSIAQYGERVQTIEGEGFLAVQALGLVWSKTTEQGWVNAAEAAATLLPRYAFGTEVISVPVRRDPTATLRAGDWVAVDLTWMPNPQTQRRGLVTFAQTFEIEDNNCAWRFLRAEVDRGQPTIAPATGSLVLTGYAPIVAGPGIAAPDAGVLTLTGFAPDAGPEIVITFTGALTLTGAAPSVDVSGTGTLPATGSLTVTGLVPTVTAT